MKKTALIFTSSLFLLHGSYAQTITSAVPGFISYQGRALDATGAVLGSTTPVNRTVNFRIWDHPSNVLEANLLYSEQQVVTISGGEFSVLIGQGVASSGTAFNYSESSKGVPTVKISDPAVFGGATRYLGVTIDDGTAAVDNEITPRQQIVSSAFAFRAKYAEQIGSNGTAALTALDSGNVGIGTIAPPALFTISGANTSTTTSTPQMLVTAADVTKRLRIGVDSTGNGTGFIQAFTEGVGAQNLLLNPNGGNVGIGTTNPTAALSVTGAITATGAITGGSFATAGSLATSSGKVGIGTTTPVARLDVIDGLTSATYGSAQISRPATGHTGAHLAIVRAGVTAVGLGFGQSSNTFGFGPGTAGAFSPGNLAIDTNNGNVGIGNPAPAFPLSMSNTMGDKIALWGSSSGTSLGFGIQNNLLQIHTDTNAGDVAFGYGSSAAMTETMRIKGNGNVGIGTKTPAYKLDVNGTARTGELTVGGAVLMTNYRAICGEDSAGVSQPTFWPQAGNGTYLNYGTAGFFIRNNASVPTMTMLNDGRVKIGTDRGDGVLNVGAIVGMHTWSRAFTSGGDALGKVASQALSIACDGATWSAVFLVSSDQRIKTTLSPTDPVKDLKTLMEIEVTDYQLKDTVTYGNDKQKKVIAQQLETVYPQAVSRQKGVVPDIYQKAGVKDGWVMLATDLKVGERVRLLGGERDSIEDVLEVRGDAFRTSLKAPTDPCFVYGREVSDFRTVDYDAVSMLNVSATQELARQLKTVQDENAALRRELAAKDQSLEARLIALEQRRSQDGVAETVSIRTANVAK